MIVEPIDDTMTNSNPIFYVIGIEGQIYMAEALGKEMNRPVIALVFCQRMMEILEKRKDHGFYKIYSLPDMYLDNIEGIKKLSLGSLNAEQKSLEEDLNTGNSALYTSYDRTLRFDGNYRKIRNWQLCCLRFVKKIFAETDPAFVVSGVATYFQHLIYDVCVYKNIPYLRASGNRTGGMVMYHADGRFIGMEKYFNDLQKNGDKAIDKQSLLEADIEFDQFVNKPEVPEYTKSGNPLGLNVTLLIKKIKYALRPTHLFPSEKIIAVDREMNIENGPVKIMLNGLGTGLRRLQLNLFNPFNSNPDLSQPYLYVPLHYAPEISDMYFGSEYDHHEGFITHLAKHIPSNCKLYVKDHMAMWGRRPYSFYKNLSKIYNVELIDPAISTFDLSNHAKATVTVTGTAGWEAYLLGKPVVVLGDVFYNFLPSVLYTSLNKDFFKKITDYLAKFKTDETECRNAYRAYYACSFKSPFVDIGETLSREKAEDMSKEYASSLHKMINTFSSEISGKFPDDMALENNYNEQTRKVL